MHDDRSIAWMMSGGNRVETAQQRREHIHRLAVREAQAAWPARGLAIRPFLSRALAIVGLGAVTEAGTPSNLDCCAA